MTMTEDTDTTDEAITALVAGRNALRDAVNAAAAAARYAHDVTVAHNSLIHLHEDRSGPRNEHAAAVAQAEGEARYACEQAARVAADAARAVARVERAARRADDDGALAYMAERAASAAARATASAALGSSAFDRVERRRWPELP